MPTQSQFFHLHLVSDATGETLITAARAAAAQYATARAIEHVYPLVRSQAQVNRVLREIDRSPGIVLYTLLDRENAKRLEDHCRDQGVPCVSVLEPILAVFQSYIGAPQQRRSGAQYALNADYFRRIEALNFTMMHDDGQHADHIDNADVVLVGISRTSKTPTSIYLANRGVRTANVPVVPGVPLHPSLFEAARPLIVVLTASADRIAQIRLNRVLSLNASDHGSTYTDKEAISREIAETRKLAARNGWPIIDVTRRSIEETAAEILALWRARVESEGIEALGTDPAAPATGS